MRSSLLLVALAALFILPATALAFRYSNGDTLAQTIPVRSLRVGDQGAPVAELQELLATRGFDPGPVDGIFGPLTLNAVLAAQRHHGLEQDGLAGRLTIGALRNQSSAPPRSAGAGAAAATAPALSADSGEALAVVDKGTLMLYEARTPSRQPTSTAADYTTPTAAASLALTFNHLPAADALEPILAALADHRMQATFFVSGEEAESSPDMLRRITEAGHEIGNLGYTEIDMRRLSPLTARAHLRRTQRMIRQATGTAPTAFRPPLGLFDTELKAIVEEEGLEMALWSNVTLFPDDGVAPQRLAQKLAEGLFPEMVLMLPLDEPHGADTLTRLLEQMEQVGFAGRKLGDHLSKPHTASTMS